ncbi:unnamed protein product [Lymnaea stagnalis]|uniref:Uncharacterized protein n=1 Tax=Lymnaea stagnalis TaxID=6523 RepID=A0AAV2HIF4_LYMST
MENHWILFIAFSNLLVGAKCECALSNWTLSMRRQGYSDCKQGKNYSYIQGIARGERASDSKDGLELIRYAQCCPAPLMWREEKTVTVSGDWKSNLDRDHHWALCPDGYFLQGLYRSASSSGRLSNLDAGRCAKPAGHPTYYGPCYEENTNCCFDAAGLCKCRRYYFLIGIYRGDCDRLHCLDKLKCCMMSENHELTY